MAKASNNQFPSVLITEGTVPDGPAAGDQRVYIDTADHHLKRVDSGDTVVDIEDNAAIDAGDVTYTPTVATDWDSDADPGDLDDALDQLAERLDDVEGAAAGVATDPIWDAAGDLAIGTAADTGSKLAIGTAAQVLAVNAGATAPEWTTAIGVCVKLANALSVPNATPTALAWETEVRDDGGCWAVGDPTKLVAPIAGWYVISAYVWWAADSDGGRRLYIVENGTATIGRQSIASPAAHNDVSNNVSAVYYLAASEYVQIYADQNAGAALNAAAGSMAQMARLR